MENSFDQYGKSDEIKLLTEKIKDDYRNIWVHLSYDELKLFQQREGEPVTTDPEINVGTASAKVLRLLALTCQFLKMLFGGS
ncbi:hypothetical protein KEJ35_05790 [Candidatus Bathyarchaeota archaeon]|nr:hypothetical protein [Candidatus Bathyarchaeota archaeon]